MLFFWNLLNVKCLILLRHGLQERVVELVDRGFLVAGRIVILDLLRLVEDLIEASRVFFSC